MSPATTIYCYLFLWYKFSPSKREGGHFELEWDLFFFNGLNRWNQTELWLYPHYPLEKRHSVAITEKKIKSFHEVNNSMSSDSLVKPVKRIALCHQRNNNEIPGREKKSIQSEAGTKCTSRTSSVKVTRCSTNPNCLGKSVNLSLHRVCFFSRISRPKKYINLVWVLPKGEPKKDTKIQVLCLREDPRKHTQHGRMEKWDEKGREVFF